MTAQTDSDTGEIRVSANAESPILYRLEVTISAGRVRKAFDRAYRDLARSAQVKGFRRGKVPRSVLERMYGAGLREEIERLLVAETLPDALELAELVPVSEPDVEADRPDPGADFRYSARIEIKPAIELPALEGLPAKRPPVEVEDDEIARELESLRERAAPLVEEPEDTEAAVGHTLNVDYLGRIDGEPFEGGAGSDATIELGAGRMIPGFEDGLVGARSGEEREVAVTFPDDYNTESLRGCNAVFTIQVHSIRKREPANLDDEFAKDLGDFDSLDDLRARIRSDLEQSRERQARSVLQRTVMDSLIERSEFEVPAGMVERQLQQQVQSLHRQFEGQMPHDVLHQQLARVQEEGRPAAERRVREILLLEAVAAARAIEVGDDELEARLAQMAESQGIDASKLRKLARDQGWDGAVRAELQEHKALDFLTSEAKIEETAET